MNKIDFLREKIVSKKKQIEEENKNPFHALTATIGRGVFSLPMPEDEISNIESQMTTLLDEQGKSEKDLADMKKRETSLRLDALQEQINNMPMANQLKISSAMIDYLRKAQAYQDEQKGRDDLVRKIQENNSSQYIDAILAKSDDPSAQTKILQLYRKAYPGVASEYGIDEDSVVVGSSGDIINVKNGEGEVLAIPTRKTTDAKKELFDVAYGEVPDSVYEAVRYAPQLRMVNKDQKKEHYDNLSGFKEFAKKEKTIKHSINTILDIVAKNPDYGSPLNSFITGEGTASQVARLAGSLVFSKSINDKMTIRQVISKEVNALKESLTGTLGRTGRLYVADLKNIAEAISNPNATADAININMKKLKSLVDDMASSSRYVKLLVKEGKALTDSALMDIEDGVNRQIPAEGKDPETIGPVEVPNFEAPSTDNAPQYTPPSGPVAPQSEEQKYIFGGKEYSLKTPQQMAVIEKYKQKSKVINNG